MGRVLSLSRYIVLLGVVASLCVATLLFLAVLVNLVLVFHDALESVGDAKDLKLLGIDSIELVDLVLIATALYIVSLGLYILFIGPVRMPGRLHIASLDGLKENLISVVVVVLGVSFLSQAASWDGRVNLLPFGAAIGAVILALSAYSLVRLRAQGNRQEHGTAAPNSDKTTRASHHDLQPAVMPPASSPNPDGA